MWQVYKGVAPSSKAIAPATAPTNVAAAPAPATAPDVASAVSSQSLPESGTGGSNLLLLAAAVLGLIFAFWGARGAFAK